MQATEVFRYGDHVGGIVHNRDAGTLHGVSWGSRRFYRWTLDGQGRVGNADIAPEKLRVANPAHYIDYQDCKYLSRGEMLCSGLTNYQIKADAPRFALGGIEIVDLSTNRVTHQVHSIGRVRLRAQNRSGSSPRPAACAPISCTRRSRRVHIRGRWSRQAMGVVAGPARSPRRCVAGAGGRLRAVKRHVPHR